MVRVSVVGANGYTGVELLNIFRMHPEIKVTGLCSQSNSGLKVTDLYPGYQAYRNEIYQPPDYEKLAEVSDAVFTALPHGASAEAVAKLHSKGVKVIDLSADFRYNDVSLYEATYKVNHPAKDLKGVYGLPELFRDKIKNADIVGNPGCYVTSALLPLYPLLKEGVIEAERIIIDSASGVSGAGRKAELSLNFCEVNENFKAYSLCSHRHTSEIEEKLSEAAGKPVAVQFSPHLLPVQRGILSTIYLRLRSGRTSLDVKAVYEAYYGKERFVAVDHDGNLPSINHVKYSNYCRIGYVYDGRTGNLIVVSALDNLIKGASGQAVQNMNIIMGLPEEMGLLNQPYHI